MFDMYLKRKGNAILNSIIIMLSVVFLGSATVKLLLIRGEMVKLINNTNVLYESSSDVVESIDLINSEFSNEELEEIIDNSRKIQKGDLVLTFINNENKFELENKMYRKKLKFRYEKIVPCKCNNENCIINKSDKIIIKPDIEVIYD